MRFYGLANSRFIDSPYHPSLSFIPNFIVNNDEISMGGAVYSNVSSGTITTATTDTSTCTYVMPTYKLIHNLIVNNDGL